MVEIKTKKGFLLFILSFLMLMNTNLVIGQNKYPMNQVYEECYEVSKQPEQWIRLELIPNTFHLSKLEEGTVISTLSKDHPWIGTGYYVTVQRMLNGKWTEVKASKNQIRNDILKSFGESTLFSHPFFIPNYFQKNELIPGKYRILKSFKLYEVDRKDIFLSTEFEILK